LNKKGWEGPGLCILCKHNTEDIDHLFVHCSFSKAVWSRISYRLHFKNTWAGNTLIECLDSWTKNNAVSNRLAAITCWNIWIERNKAIFEEKAPSAWVVVYKTLGSPFTFPLIQKVQNIRQRPIALYEDCTCAFFDGASTVGGQNCGAGGTIICSDTTEYRWFVNCGGGTNTKAELLGAWATLTLAKYLNIQNLQLMGDSKVIIEWLKHNGNLQSTSIEGWKHRTLELIASFQAIHYHHIYMEFNKVVDLLSKQALLEPKGRLSYFIWDGGKNYNPI
jgi:ribonuclease HI